MPHNSEMVTLLFEGQIWEECAVGFRTVAPCRVLCHITTFLTPAGTRNNTGQSMVLTVVSVG